MEDKTVKTLIYAMILVALCGIIVQLAIENFQLKAIRQNRGMFDQIQTNAQNIQSVVDFVNAQARQIQPQLSEEQDEKK